MWDQHLDGVNKPKYQIELNSKNTRPVHAAPYRAGTIEEHLAVNEMQKML